LKINSKLNALIRYRICSGKINTKRYFEIKSNELRSLFKYTAGKIIVIGVIFVKKTQKTPKDKIKLAMQRLKEV